MPKKRLPSLFYEKYKIYKKKAHASLASEWFLETDKTQFNTTIYLSLKQTSLKIIREKLNSAKHD
jgi:hypothetical protein